MGIRFVTPESVRVPIGDGADYIVIKKRLTHGEREHMHARMMNDPGEVRTCVVLAFLIGWSAPDPMGPDLSEHDRVDTIRNLDPDTFDEIEVAINTHVASIAQEKKLKNGTPVPDQTFASAV